MVVSLKTLVSWNSFGIRIRCKHPSTISAVSLTFWLLSQTGMWARGWVWEAIAVYDLWVILGWGLGAPWQGRVWEIHMVEPKLLLIACCPLQVVHQCPGSVAPQVDTVEHNGCRREQREDKQVSAHPSASQGRKVLQNIHTWHTGKLLPTSRFTQCPGLDTAFRCSKNQSFCARNKGLGIEKKTHQNATIA